MWLFAGTHPANKNLFAGTVAGTPQVGITYILTPEIDCMAKKNISFSVRGYEFVFLSLVKGMAKDVQIIQCFYLEYLD